MNRAGLCVGVATQCATLQYETNFAFIALKEGPPEKVGLWSGR